MLRFDLRVLRLSTLSLLSLLACLVIGLNPNPIFAQTGLTFNLSLKSELSRSLQNSYFHYEAGAGELIEDVVVVQNSGNEPVQLALYAADAQTADNGGITFPNKDQTASDVGTWLKLAENELTLAPNETREIPFTFAIPAGITGEHAAGIVAQRLDSQESSSSQGSGVTFVPSVGMTVLVNIAGTVAQQTLEITDLASKTSRGQQAIIATLHNTGNVGLHTEGTLSIQQTNGTIERQIPMRLGYFLAGDTLTYPIALNPALPAGDYDITLSLDHEGGNVQKAIRLPFTQPAQIERRELGGEQPAPTQPENPEKQPFTLADIPLTWFLIGGGLIIVFILLFLIQSVRLRLANAQSQPKPNRAHGEPLVPTSPPRRENKQRAAYSDNLWG
ncbi:MAG: WxL protein peptidoglycan domain-containing protein [Ardenticatenaceae bacterium]